MARYDSRTRSASRGRGSSYDEALRRVGQNRSLAPRSLWPVALGFLLCLVVVCLRLVDLTVLRADRYRQTAEETWSTTLRVPAKRGTIYDRSGNVLAMSVECKDVYANPAEIADVQATAAVLAQQLGGSAQDYMGPLTESGTFSYIQKKVDLGVAERLEDVLYERELTGIHFLDNMTRVYPYGSIGNQILGIVGDDGYGLSGLEYYYEDILAGVDGEMVLELGNNGVPVAGGKTEITEVHNGEDLVISLDINIQRVAEEQISKGVGDYDAESGSVMVIDPKTGEILAACSTPFVDFADQTSITDDALRLRLVSDSYEPGSVFKLITMASGLEAGIIEPTTSLWVPAHTTVGFDQVGDDDDRSYDMDMTVTEILRRSSNVGAVTVASLIGPDVFAEGVASFGIGTPTGIDFPGETQGLVTPREKYIPATLGAMSFGQSVAVPGVQIVRAVAAIANDGVLTTPHFLVSRSGERVSWETGDNAISEETAHELTQMMRVVIDEGTGVEAQVRGYDVAGKTGTGEQAKEGELGYEEDAYMSSLVGFANADDAEVLVYVSLNGTPYLAEASAAPLFSAIMSEALNDLGVTPQAIEV